MYLLNKTPGTKSALPNPIHNSEPRTQNSEFRIQNSELTPCIDRKLPFLPLYLLRLLSVCKIDI